MGYEDGRAGQTGKLGEAEAQRFLQDHGYLAVRPTGRDHGIDLIITSGEHPAACATAQVKGRRQLRNPRWFQLSITPASIRDAWKRNQNLEEIWQDKIRMVDFWIMVSIPLKEVWIFPSDKVFEIALLNTSKYITRLDNQYDKPHYDKNGRVQKKQKELNLDIPVNGSPLWTRFTDYRNQIAVVRTFFESINNL